MFELRTKTWLNAAEVQKRVVAASVTRLAKCALLVEGEMKRSLSKGGKKIVSRDDNGKFVRSTQSVSGPAGEPPRLRTGNLRSSIQSARTERLTYLVGPATTAFYGRMHEYGAVINVTPKMRGYLAAVLGIHLAKGTTQIIIPKRPFARPALLKMASKFPELFRDLPLGGDIGGGK